MASTEALMDIIVQSQKALTSVLQTLICQCENIPTVDISIFYGRSKNEGDLTLTDWLDDVETYCRECHFEGTAKVNVAIDHLGGVAREEVFCSPPEYRKDFSKIVGILKARFGSHETVHSLRSMFCARKQKHDESLADFGRALMLLYDRIEKVASNPEEGKALACLRERSLREQFIGGALDSCVRLELRSLGMKYPDLAFYQFRDVALGLFVDLKKAANCSFSVDPYFDHPVTAVAEQSTNCPGDTIPEQGQTSEHIRDIPKPPSVDHSQQSLRPPSCSHCLKQGHVAQTCIQHQCHEVVDANYNQGLLSSSCETGSDFPEFAMPALNIKVQEKAGNAVDPPVMSQEVNDDSKPLECQDSLVSPIVIHENETDIDLGYSSSSDIDGPGETTSEVVLSSCQSIPNWSRRVDTNTSVQAKPSYLMHGVALLPVDELGAQRSELCKKRTGRWPTAIT